MLAMVNFFQIQLGYSSVIVVLDPSHSVLMEEGRKEPAGASFPETSFSLGKSKQKEMKCSPLGPYFVPGIMLGVLPI